jgi:DNA anti-recombination protein RmuC
MSVDRELEQDRDQWRQRATSLAEQVEALEQGLQRIARSESGVWGRIAHETLRRLDATRR